jgi:hypothetical protein
MMNASALRGWRGPDLSMVYSCGPHKAIWESKGTNAPLIDTPRFWASRWGFEAEIADPIPKPCSGLTLFVYLVSGSRWRGSFVPARGGLWVPGARVPGLGVHRGEGLRSSTGSGRGREASGGVGRGGGLPGSGRTQPAWGA